ncbi:recombinase family protein [Salmonella enterica]|nr:recombinase family protein [Salmonella enterica]
MNQSYRVYAYLRASTKEQDATRATKALKDFATDKGLTIVATFTENESGASLQRPELFRLLDVAQSGDVILIEQIDRLSRLSGDDWQKLRSILSGKGVKVVALDLPTSYMLLNTGDEFTSRMFEAVNGMMLDMLAAIARKDYTDRKRRQAEGIEKAKQLGKFKGRPVDNDKREKVMTAFNAGMTKNQIFKITGIARTTINRILEDAE